MEAFYLILSAAFLQGFSSTFHCISMCGPLSLTFQSVDKSKWLTGIYYNSGRMISYSIIGAVFGGAGGVINKTFELEGIQKLSALFAFLFLLIFGLQLIFPNIKFSSGFIEKLKKPIYPIFHKARKINKPFLSNLLVGMVSGFLPCGVLYPAYILSFGTGDIFLGALTMGTFFIGTFPGLYLFGIGYNSLKNKISTKFLPVIGVLIIAFGLGSLYMRMGFGHKPHCHDHKTMEHKH